MKEINPVYLSVRQGDLVVVEDNSLTLTNSCSDWWIGQVIYIVGSARNPDSNSLLQVIDIDSGVVKTINADLVSRQIAFNNDNEFF